MPRRCLWRLAPASRFAPKNGPEKKCQPGNAALFYDLVLSKEGQAELAREDNMPVREDVEIAAKELAKRFKEAKGQKRFVVQSPGTYDPAQEEKADRLYINTLIKKR